MELDEIVLINRSDQLLRAGDVRAKVNGSCVTESARTDRDFLAQESVGGTASDRFRTRVRDLRGICQRLQQLSGPRSAVRDRFCGNIERRVAR